MELTDILDILAVTFIIYQCIKLVRDTRAFQLLKGILALMIIYWTADQFSLDTLSFIMRNVMSTGVLALVIVFQPELRRILEQLAQTKLSNISLFNVSQEEQERRRQQTSYAINVVCDACEELSASKTGALLVFERKTRLGEIVKTGTVVDAYPTKELLGNIFFVNTPLHDGATIIREGRVYASGCFLPLSENYTISKEMGTRHRAALGMSENSDAVIVVVSEETGIISVAEGGKIQRRLTVNALKTLLRRELLMIDDSEEAPAKKPLFGKVKK